LIFFEFSDIRLKKGKGYKVILKLFLLLYSIEYPLNFMALVRDIKVEINLKTMNIIIIFCFGFIIGGILVLSAFLGGLYIHEKYKTTISNVINTFANKEKAYIYNPNHKKVKNQKIIDRNKKEGKHTKLTDLI
jgi:hypothetical protein